jgi:branched-chain amino acid transport system permease protein
MLGGVFVTLTVKMIELVQGVRAVQDFQHDHQWLDLNALRMIIYASVLIALMIWRPEGMLGERELFGRKKVRK